ncbi:anaphase-promoting complex subunit 4 [Venturia canescens]|uniref:anaphase-promoting complex subunit 4 n=1 Tax=Venturia canescens TaxID=32260 RepID=UPI001C9D659C|nr:anaphase-promoting complex subunit 4 [Venturia canescens]XP_043267358.1 anaphase-promoting complex subunit 4 [Venturia canescens]XP_043267359.1 anaphase-promoting complex subunit 4 [Venturia canescens]XP_043267360.1 anaphase-promoting complex subunit 4 [Venturia canescens]
MSGAMRQLEERQLPAEVTIMRWSPKMDLLAIANKKGEVALHRLTWQRVWLLSPQDETDDTVANLAWRPDGKLLAISYTNSKNLCLIDIENKNIIHKKPHESSEKVTCMSWLPIGNLDNDNSGHPLKSMTSPTGEYLPSLPSLNRGFGQEPDRKDYLFQTLDMLFVGLEDSGISMYVFGMFYCGTIKVGNGPVSEISGGSGGPILASCREQNCIKVYRLSCPLLERSGAFLKIAQVQANIECLMDYLSHTLMAISEAWETILLEMDEKLARYADSNPPCAMAADFLELLMIGIPTQELENFLLRDLTEKGLKKLGHSIEMCYSNIQKLVLKHLSSVGMALVYQLGEMRGMARLGGPYESLGLKDETPVTKGLHAAEAFLAKSSEIQQVIDHSMRDYKAFFRWLYVVIARLTDERVPSEASRVSQQELTFIADFLRGFDKTDNTASGRKGVNLEKLCQYLRREPLQTCLTAEGSEWAALLTENKCLRDHPLIVKQDLDSSLLQSHEKLVGAIKDVFSEAYQSLVSHFSVTSIALPLSKSSQDTQIVTSDENLLIAASDPERKALKLFKIETSCVETRTLSFKKALVSVDARNASFTEVANDLTISDLQFYSQGFLSLLLVNRTNYASYLVQMPISETIFEVEDDSAVSLGEIVGTSWPRPFQGISARRLAVSGARKVAAILSESSRKIRLLETEVEPEDEEDKDEDDTIDESLMDTSNSNVPGTSS